MAKEETIALDKEPANSKYNQFLNKRMNDMGWSIKGLAECLGCDEDRVRSELTTPSAEYKKRLMKALNISETEWLEVIEHKSRKSW